MSSIRSLFATRLYQSTLAGIDPAELEKNCLVTARDDKTWQDWCEENAFPGYTTYAVLTEIPLAAHEQRV